MIIKETKTKLIINSGENKKPSKEKEVTIVYYQRRKWHPTPVFLPGKSNGQRSLYATVHRIYDLPPVLDDLV